MRIAVYHNLPSGGAKRALHTQVQQLQERGHELECWTPVISERDYLPLRDLMPVHVLPYSLPWAAWHKLSPRSLDLYQKLWCSTGALASFARHAAREIGAGRCDVLLAANCRYLAAPAVARFAGCPSLFYCQEPYRAFYEPATGNPLMMHRQTRIDEERVNARAFDAVLANSRYSKSRIDNVYGIESEVNYLGVDTNRFKPTGEPRGDFVIGVGAIQPHKRIELAIIAVAQLENPPKLIWVGNMCSPAYRAELEALALDASVDLDLRLQIPDTELVSLLSRAKLFIYTSRREPFGLTPLEANACGTPVVAVREGGMRETIRDGINGVLCHPKPDALYPAMAELLSSPERTEQLRASARDYVVTEWNWQRSIDQLEQRLEQLREKGRHERHD